MRHLFPIVAVFALVLPDVGAAQGLKFDPRPIEACLDADGWSDCIGQGADLCMQTTPGGDTTMGMAGCLSAELDWWQADLDVAVVQFLDTARAADASFEPIPGLEPRPSMEQAAQATIAAWHAWREADCRYEHLRWWGGTGAMGAEIACRMRATGEQVLRLRSLMAAG